MPSVFTGNFLHTLMPTFDEYLTSITQDHFLPKVVDNVLNSNVAAVRWLSKGKAWMGEQLRIPFKYQKNTSSGSFAPGDTFVTAKVNTRQRLAFDPKWYYQSVTLLGPEVDVNAINETQVINLVKTEMESASQDMVDSIGTVFYGTGTGDDFLGLGGIIDDGSNLGTYGGLSRTTFTQLNSDVTSSAGNLTIAIMASSQDAAKRGSQKPTIGITTESVWTDYEALVASQLAANYSVMGTPRVTRDATVQPGLPLGPGQAGFDALMHRGTPIVADEKSTSGTIFWVNENHLGWYGIKPVWATPISLGSTTIEGYYSGNDVPSDNHGFSVTEWKEPSNQYARVKQILLAGNLISGGPRYHSKDEGLT